MFGRGSGKPGSDMSTTADTRQPAAPDQATSTRWDVWAYLAVFIERRRTIVRGAFVGGVVAVGVALVLPPVYTTEVQFTPAESSKLSSLVGVGGLAALGGLLTPEQQGSPFFYVALAQSDEITRAVILKGYRVTADSTATLIDIDRVSGKTPAERLEREIIQLQKRVTTSVDREAGIVTLRVDASTPELSSAIAEAFLEAINRFNVDSRNSSAHAKRVFLDARARDLETTLHAAEDSLRNFLMKNRSFENSPNLTFEYGRLKRRVDADQDLYLTVRQQHELAKIDEVKDIPLITVVQPAHPPLLKSRPKRRVLALAGVMVGVLIAYLVVLVELYLAAVPSEGRQGWVRLSDAWQGVRRNVRSVFRR
jgi:uncharacterized protein involved in exopolysaccharide biosynthesis